MSCRTPPVRPRARVSLLAAAVAPLAAVCAPLSGQSPATAELPQGHATRISVTWEEAPIREVLAAFAAFSGASIVSGAGVEGFVTADINDQPWDVALRTILASQGLVGIEEESGIIRVDAVAALHDRQSIAPMVTRAYRISYARAEELQSAVASVLSPRGSVSVVPSTNTLVVSDIERSQRAVAALLH